MCSSWQQFRATANIQQQSIFNEAVMLKRRDHWSRLMLCFSMSESLNSLLIPLVMTPYLKARAQRWVRIWKGFTAASGSCSWAGGIKTIIQIRSNPGKVEVAYHRPSGHRKRQRLCLALVGSIFISINSTFFFLDLFVKIPGLKQLVTKLMPFHTLLLGDVATAHITFESFIRDLNLSQPPQTLCFFSFNSKLLTSDFNHIFSNILCRLKIHKFWI